ncbi:MAG: translocation/assembly module TamB domain-containing protein [Propionivibrio sp.]|uniref:Translocation/assembly module TamB domain-containing protein n=1 Tax=Candidatus Propionivibrio dominans TaxID=2954373 RepID=A0A9D7FD76_9RHOO|nr:translocation/assembly module TamB domain-containing protein [Candidatus Propionivibrio dominans]
MQDDAKNPRNSAEQAEPQPHAAPTEARRFRRTSRWRWMLAVGGVLLAALGWLGGSEGGLRFLCAQLVQLSAGRLQIEAPGGRLLGDWHAQSVRWLDATEEVEVQHLTVRWSPRELLRGELVFERIEAASLHIFHTASAGPMPRPVSLELPLALRINQLLLGRATFGEGTEYGRIPLLLAAGIDAGFASDGRTHRLERVQAQLGELALTASATLAGEPPFALTAQAVLNSAALEQPVLLNLLGSGSLEHLQIDGQLSSGATDAKPPESTLTQTAIPGKPASDAAAPAVAAGELHALLTPFATQALASLRLQMSNLDPSLFAAGAPQARLDVEARLDSRATAPGTEIASGHLRIANRLSGALDRNLLPLTSLQAQINWQGERLAFDELILELSGGGRLKGQGHFAGGRLELDLLAHNVDAHALYARLLPTRLAGPLRARFGGDSQNLELDLRDAQFALNARASLTPEALEVSHLQLARGEARLAAQGRLALAGEGRFTAQGSVQNFDPARFLQRDAAVRSMLNAGFEASGALRPALELGLHFELRNSRIGTQLLAGKGDVDLLGSHLRKVDIDLEAAGNRLSALGAFGKAGDTLRLTVRAPGLEALGWPGLAGDARADFVLGGSLASPVFSGELQATRLRLARQLDVQGLSFNGQLGAGAQGVLSGLLRCTACELPAYGIPALALEARAEGLRQRHRLELRAGLPDKREIRVALDGGLHEEAARRPGAANSGGNPPALSWSGTLSELRVAARTVGKVNAETANAAPLLRLTAPAPLRLSRTALAFGPALIDGLIGNLRIERLGHEQGRWQSAGRWQNFRPQAVLAEFPAIEAQLEAFDRANPQALVLGGEWDFALNSAARPVGRAAVWREGGDLVLGKLPLGLGEARLQASLDAGRLAVKGQVHGSRLGDISLEWNAQSALGAGGATQSLIDRQAPWQGRLQARLPDLSWFGPLLGEGWKLAGQLDGELLLAGSAARPRLSGDWRGSELALRTLDRGMRLERGQALLEITPERLILHRLSFESDFQPLPRALKLEPNVDAALLTGTPGSFEASGELPLTGVTPGSAARLKLRLDRVGVMQRPDQWVAVSGEGELRVGERVLDVVGKLRVDAGFWSLGEAGRPRLSDDVVIRQAQSEGGRSRVRQVLRLDLEADLGRSFHFSGAGVESRLDGQLRIRSNDAGLPRASGSISTVDGRFDAYGQKLDIERGIINFQGAIDNPGLNILAVRRNLAVEAGVEVTGTAQRPLVRLVSTPNVPDTEKLSWLVLGRSPDQQGGRDSALLLAAAQTILGGQDGGALRQLQRGLGIDEIGVSRGQLGGVERLPTSRVAGSSGFGNSQTVNGQIVSVGKRLSANTLLSYEQSLDTMESIVKLTHNLSRRVSLVARAGSDNALDVFWNYSFGR